MTAFNDFCLDIKYLCKSFKTLYKWMNLERNINKNSIPFKKVYIIQVSKKIIFQE